MYSRLSRRLCIPLFKHCLLLQRRGSTATNAASCKHGSNEMSKEQSEQKALDAMEAASSDSDFEKLLSEVSHAGLACPEH